MLCDFAVIELHADGKTTCRCRRCGATVRARGPKVSRVCRVKQLGPCRHLGSERFKRECPTCRGKVLVKIFACELLELCSLAKPIDGIACCATCDQFRSRT